MNPKFIARENPLDSYFELNEDQKLAFKMAVKADLLEDLLIDVQLHLEKTPPNVKDALKEIEFYYKGFNEHLEKDYAEKLTWLKTRHCGDCISLPAGCPQCWAENLIGLNSLSGLTRNMGYCLHSAFLIGKTLNGTLEILNNSKKDKDESYRQIRTDTLNWLTEYKNKYFGGEK